MYGREGEGYYIETISYTSSKYCFGDVDFLFHGCATIFEEFTLFLDFCCGGMYLDFPYEGGDHINT